jgi:hypothetical protein
LKVTLWEWKKIHRKKSKMEELRIITVQRANLLMSHIHKVPGILSKSGNKNIDIISINLESQISKYSIC